MRSVLVAVIIAALYYADYISGIGDTTCEKNTQIKLSLKRDAVLLLIPRLSVPTLPDLDLNWPSFDLPSGEIELTRLEFSGLENLFKFPIPSFGAELPIFVDWLTVPKLTLDVSDGSLKLQGWQEGVEKGRGQLKLRNDSGGSLTIANFEDVTFKIGTSFSINGTVAAATATEAIDLFTNLNLPDDLTGPFIVSLELLTAQVSNFSWNAANEYELTLKLQLKGFEIRSRLNPENKLKLNIDLEFKYSNGNLEPSISSLQFIEPNLNSLKRPVLRIIIFCLIN